MVRLRIKACTFHVMIQENSMANKVIRAERMGVEPEGKLLISMSAPLCISMLVQALYNIVDSIFVSRIDEAALAALSLAFPIQSLMISFASGTAVGMNALLSRSLGERNHELAQKACYNGIFLEICSAIVFGLFGLFGVTAFFKVQTANPVIIDYGYQYLSIVSGFSIFFILEMTFERLLQATGNSFYNMISQTAGAVFNCIFDPIMIFGLLGFPRLGIKGAAIATVSGQLLACILALIFNIRHNKDVSVIWKKFKPEWTVIKKIYEVGIPSIVMQSITSITTYVLNQILIVYSEAAVTVYGIYFKLQSFIFMPCFGLNNGMIPIIGYNYGAKKKSRIMNTIKYAVLSSTAVMVLGTVLFAAIPGPLLSLFNASGELMSLGKIALRIIGFHFIFAGFNIVIASVYQALGNGIYALITAVLRQIIVILPAAYLLGKAFGINAVWWAFPIAEVVATATNIFLFKKIYNERICPLDY